MKAGFGTMPSQKALNDFTRDKPYTAQVIEEKGDKLVKITGDRSEILNARAETLRLAYGKWSLQWPSVQPDLLAH